jgi:hypothetical protein
MWCCARRDKSEQNVSIDVKDRRVIFKVTNKTPVSSKPVPAAETAVQVQRDHGPALTIATLAAHSAKTSS